MIGPSRVSAGCFCGGALVSADPVTRWVSGCDAEAPSVCCGAAHGIDPPREENYRGWITRWKERKLSGDAHSRAQTGHMFSFKAGLEPSGRRGSWRPACEGQKHGTSKSCEACAMLQVPRRSSHLFGLFTCADVASSAHF